MDDHKAELANLKRRFDDHKDELANLKRRFDDHKDELACCSTEKDEKIRTVEADIQKISNQLDDIQGLLEAWNTAKGFVRVIEFIAKIVRILAPWTAFLIAIWLFLKSGHWEYNKPLQ
jgi:hypothetical protein